MICDNPYVQGVRAYPCGQCMPCRINRRRLWTNRILLESCKHHANCFATLTYAPEFLPADGSLEPIHLQLFLKRLRKALSPRKIRFFAVGEYGEISFRPHYHLAIFGLDYTELEVVQSAWTDPESSQRMGHVLLGDLSRASAAYIAQYCTKKMTSADDVRLEGRYPEFTRMSLRPGIGALAVEDLAKSLSGDAGVRFISGLGDVPYTLKLGDKDIPLGRYLRMKLRRALDIYKVNPVTGEVSYGTPDDVLKQFEVEMRQLLTDKVGPPSHSSPWSKERVKGFLVSESKGKSQAKVARDKILKARRSL